MDETQDSVMTEDLHVLHRINDLMEKNTQIEFEYTTEDQTTINGLYFIKIYKLQSFRTEF